MQNLIGQIGVLLGSSWASGVNLYLTVAGLGIAQRVGAIDLPGDMSVLSHPLIITASVLMFAVEFFADKIPGLDSFWDSVHTAIRPVGAAAMGFMAMTEIGPIGQIPVALMMGAVSADSHLTKATTRLAINTSPEPVTNSIASITEDSLVLGALYLVIKHPVIAGICVVLFILFSIWFLKVMFRFVKKLFKIFSGSKPGTSDPQREGTRIDPDIDPDVLDKSL